MFPLLEQLPQLVALCLIVTLLYVNPCLLAKAASLAKEALKNRIPVRTLLENRGILKVEEVERILNVHNMTQPGIPGKQ